MNADFPSDLDESPPIPPSALGLVNIVLVLLIAAVGGLGLLALTNQYFADQQLIQTSHPFSQSKVLLLVYPEIIESVGTEPEITDTGQSTVHWNFPNAGSADIHFRIRGENNVAFANLLWSRISGRWHLLSANWTNEEGILRDIPLGPNGRFLNAEELKLYHRTDPLTPLGRGERALLEGRYPAALREYLSAVDANPKDIRALVGRGKAYLHSGQSDLAMKDFQTALEIDPSDTEANRLLAQLELERPAKAAP